MSYSVGGWTRTGRPLGGSECKTLEEAREYFEYLKASPAPASLSIYEDDEEIESWMA